MGYQRAAPLLAAYGMIASLAACGFTPVYGPEAQMDQKLSNIEVAPPNNRVEYLFVRSLEERIGHNPAAENILNHDITVFEEGLEIWGAARSQLVGKVRYKLVSQDDGQVIATGSVETFTSYTPTIEGFGSNQRDATKRLMQILADKITTDLHLKLLGL